MRIFVSFLVSSVIRIFVSFPRHHCQSRISIGSSKDNTDTMAYRLIRASALSNHLDTSKASLTCSMIRSSTVIPAFSLYPNHFSTMKVPVPKPPTSNHPFHKVEGAKGSLIYTETDEAPALATFSLLPILSKFSAMSKVNVVPCDISLSGRVLAAFPEKLKESQRVPDNLSYLGELCKKVCFFILLANIYISYSEKYFLITYWIHDCIAGFHHHQASKRFSIHPSIGRLYQGTSF